MIKKTFIQLTAIALLTLFIFGCGKKEIPTVTIEAMLQSPLDYSGKAVRVEVRTMTQESMMYDFYAEDTDSTEDMPARIPVKFAGNIPPDDTIIDLCGKLMMVSSEYVFFADSIDYGD